MPTVPIRYVIHKYRYGYSLATIGDTYTSIAAYPDVLTTSLRVRAPICAVQPQLLW